MELTKKERLAFGYQLRILEALYPDDADHYASHRKAIEEGYVLHYDWLTEHLYDELGADECREVLDVLDMYRAIKFSLGPLPADEPLKQHHLANFAGYDGNNEGHHMSYVHYLVVDLDRFQEQRVGEFPSFNSHCPMIPTYRSMLERWRAIPIVGRHKLTREQIADILGA